MKQVPHFLKRFTSYVSDAHTSFFKDKPIEGIATFGLSKKQWLAIWHFRTVTWPYLWGIRHLRMFIWKYNRRW